MDEAGVGAALSLKEATGLEAGRKAAADAVARPQRAAGRREPLQICAPPVHTEPPLNSLCGKDADLFGLCGGRGVAAGAQRSAAGELPERALNGNRRAPLLAKSFSSDEASEDALNTCGTLVALCEDFLD